MNDKNDITHVWESVSLLARKSIQRMRLLMRYGAWSPEWITGRVLLLVLAVSAYSQAAVSVQIPAALQEDFIAETADQWVIEVKPGLFASDKKIIVSAKKEIPTEPTPPPIQTASALEACLAHGVGDGMEFERKANVQSLYGLQAKDAIDKTCGGMAVDTLTSTSTIMGACIQTYNNAAATINIRWGHAFDSEGNIVP